MAIQHVNITDPYVHEPKGITSAPANTAYVADGSGSGSWSKVDLDAMDTVDLYLDIQDKIATGALPIVGKGFLSTVIPDVSTPSSVLLPILQDCVIKRARLVLGGALSTANATVSFKTAVGDSLGTSVTITQSGSSEGTSFTFNATSNNSIIGPSFIKIETDGGSTNTVPLYILVEYEYTFNKA